jgi:hypothetical protein
VFAKRNGVRIYTPPELKITGFGGEEESMLTVIGRLVREFFEFVY